MFSGGVEVMTGSSKLFEMHSFYNLSRYLYLKIEKIYNSRIEKSGITLPQLRVLWVIKAFPEISSNKIAIIGCLSKPTVSMILKKLLAKELILMESANNSKIKKIIITKAGIDYININKQKKGDLFPLFNILETFNGEELMDLFNAYKYLMKESNNSFIFEYIDRINEIPLKIEYETFEAAEVNFLKDLVCLYNCLRIFILTIENSHNILLKKLNITFPQLRALKILKVFNGITSSELSGIAIWSPSTANLVVKNLYNKDLICKKKGSIKNSLHIYTTDNGNKIIEEDLITNHNKIEILKLVENFPLQEIRKLNKLLYGLNLCLHNHRAQEYIIKSFEYIRN